MATVQHQQPVTQGHRLGLVVGHKQAGDAQPPLQPTDLGAHLDAQPCVEVGQRLIEQEQFWLAHDGAAHRHALALPAGQLARLASEQRPDAEQCRCVLHPPADVIPRQTTNFQCVGHVGEHCHVRIERVVLTMAFLALAGLVVLLLAPGAAGGPGGRRGGGPRRERRRRSGSARRPAGADLGAHGDPPGDRRGGRARLPLRARPGARPDGPGAAHDARRAARLRGRPGRGRAAARRAAVCVLVPAAVLGVVLERTILGPVMSHIAADYAVLPLAAGFGEIALLAGALVLIGAVAVGVVARQALAGARVVTARYDDLPARPDPWPVRGWRPGARPAVAGCGARVGDPARGLRRRVREPAADGSTLASTWVDPNGSGVLRVGPENRSSAHRARRTQPAPALLATLAHVTDAHVLDAQSPARVPFLARLGRPSTDLPAPQTLTAQVAGGALAAVDASRRTSWSRAGT